MIKVRIKNTWTKAMENQRPKEAMVPKKLYLKIVGLTCIELDCMPKSFWSVVPMFVTVQNSPWSLEMLLAKTESSCTICIGKCYVCAHGK